MRKIFSIINTRIPPSTLQIEPVQIGTSTNLHIRHDMPHAIRHCAFDLDGFRLCKHMLMGPKAVLLIGYAKTSSHFKLSVRGASFAFRLEAEQEILPVTIYQGFSL